MGTLHAVHKRRARRCAMIRLTEVAKLNVGTPMLLKRVSVSGAEFVCSVDSTVCPVCAAFETVGAFQVFEANPNGCPKCTNGFKGRIGIYEVVKITPELSRIIMEEGNSIQVAEQARKHGYNDLRRSGLRKVMQGLTSLAEANRVTTGH